MGFHNKILYEFNGGLGAWRVQGFTAFRYLSRFRFEGPFKNGKSLGSMQVAHVVLVRHGPHATN